MSGNKNFNSYSLKDLEERIKFVKNVLNLTKQGMAQKDIITKLGCNPDDNGIVCRVCKANGIVFDSEKFNDIVRKIKNLMSKGVTLDDALTIIKITRQTFATKCKTFLGCDIIDFELSILNKSKQDIQNDIVSAFNSCDSDAIGESMILEKMNYKISKTVFKQLAPKEIKIYTDDMAKKINTWSDLYRKGFTTNEIADISCLAYQNVCLALQNHFGKDWKTKLRSN